MTKKWYLSKTLWVGVLEILLAVLGLLATFLETGDFSASSYVLLVSGVITILLRIVTSERLTF